MAWWHFALAAPGIYGILKDLLGGGDEAATQQQIVEQVTEEEPRGYQSPLIGLLDPWMLQTLLGRYGLLSGAGMPGGQGYMNPWTQEIIRLLGQEWPEILGGYGLEGYPTPGKRRIFGSEPTGSSRSIGSKIRRIGG